MIYTISVLKPGSAPPVRKREPADSIRWMEGDRQRMGTCFRDDTLQGKNAHFLRLASCRKGLDVVVGVALILKTSGTDEDLQSKDYP